MTFANELQAKANQNVKTIILPEPEDARVLKAADSVLGTGAVNVVLIGDAKKIAEDAKSLNLHNIERAEIIAADDDVLLSEAAELLAQIRASKGLTLEEASKIVKADISTFATLLVKLGKADGMVSGAIHTTADTIRPALQIIKTKPGRKTVSGAFFMCIPGSHRGEETVLVYADCAVNPNPTPEIIADIALASNETAKQFGLDSKVALLSYSTGTSGKGADVDATVEAVELLGARAKDEGVEIEFEGPIQYDAATDEEVAKTKMPESKVAGKATVFVFPDLKSGNITYKAVQRSANALAVGPVLQGLNSPVNDLSRGALVEDIVNTIYLTAIQAGI
ncbi:MAG: phosphate acetyltransferase [Candidatus Ancillula sp.]|jgi:phosphate acetyltransferase|nr:phosphate acetyltransferase [Candidatus Ancillula sp.]